MMHAQNQGRRNHGLGNALLPHKYSHKKYSITILVVMEAGLHGNLYMFWLAAPSSQIDL